MADTFTAKLGLRQYDPTLFYDVSKLSGDNLLVDNAFGTVICTSTTRPSTGLFNGMQLWETDTRRFVIRVAGAWVVVPVRAIVADQTARAAITTPYDGMMIYRQDRDWNEVYDGAAWRVVGVAHCTSVADRDGASGITSPYNGQLVITTDTYTLWMRQAGAWVDPYTRFVGGTQRSANSGAIGNTETIFATSGSLSLPANSTFRVSIRCSYFISVGGDEFEYRIRETNLAGATAFVHDTDSVEFSGVPKVFEATMPYKTTTAETKTWVATVKRQGGSGTITCQSGSGVFVDYLGPSSLLGTSNP